LEIKQHIFQEFIDLNPMNLWSSEALQKKLCMHISEEVTEVGEMLYEYATISKSDLIYLKHGSIHAYIELDHGKHFSCHYNVTDHLFRTEHSSTLSDSSPTSTSSAFMPGWKLTAYFTPLKETTLRYSFLPKTTSICSPS
jgi:hypothetical protein